MKNLTKASVLLVTLVMFLSCATKVVDEPRRAGELPTSWWKISDVKGVGALENIYRDDSLGVESKVKLFVASSDEPTNASESDAISDATRKVAVEISQYMVLQVTAVSQSAKFNDYIKQSVTDTNVDTEAVEKVINDIKVQTNEFTATLSNTQFSSMKKVGTHAEPIENGARYKGWVCVSMNDQILEQTAALQREAFKNITELNPEYKQLMSDINTELTKQIKENVSSKTEF